MKMSTLPRRRWSYSLRTLFVAMNAMAVIFGWLASELNSVRYRKLVYQEIAQSFGNGVLAEPHPVFSIRRMMGNLRFSEIALIPDSTDAELCRAQAAFPEADVYIANGAGFIGAEFR